MRNLSEFHPSLTDSRVEKFSNTASKSDIFIRDPNLKGFALRVSPKDVKSFVVEATVQGRFVRRVLGRFPLLTVKEARQKALEALRDLKYGEPPSSKKDRSESSLRALVEAFLADRQSVLRSSTMTDYSRILRADYFSDWMDAPVQGMNRRAVLDRYQKLCSENGTGMANKSMRVLSSVLNYGKAIEPSLEEWANPLRVLSEARARKQLKPRTGHIPPAKLADWFSALDTYANEARSDRDRERRSDIRSLFTLILMTGLRINEALTLRWSQIDFDKGTLRIEGDQAKNHQELTIPLNSWLVRELATRFKKSAGRSYGEAKSSRCFELKNLKRAYWRISELAGVEFTPHDLRRSFATYLDLTGAPFSAIKQLLNHVSSSDVTSRYIQKRSIDDLRGYAEAVRLLITKAQTQTVAHG